MSKIGKILILLSGVFLVGCGAAKNYAIFNTATTKLGAVPLNGQPFFNQFGTKAVYVKYDSATGKSNIFDEGKKSEDFESIFSVEFAADGRTIIYKGQKDEKTFLVTGETKKEIQENAFEDGMMCCTFSNASGKEAALINTYNKETDTFGRYVLFDGQKGPAGFIEFVVVNPDGKSYAYTIGSEGNYFVVHGTEKYGPFYYVGRPVFSPDGKKLFFWAQEVYSISDSQSYFFINGQKVRTLTNKFHEQTKFIFSSDSKKIGYSEFAASHSYFIDDFSQILGIEPYDANAINKYVNTDHFSFSSDGKYFGFGQIRNGENDAGLWWKVVKIEE